MCLNPISIRNKSKYIDYKHGHYLYYTVPCGKCSECIQDRVDSYMIRSYAECQECHEHGGLCFVDTLTYDDAHVPHHKDFNDLLVFSKKDIQLFLKRLVTRLRRLGYYKPENVTFVDYEGHLQSHIKKIVPLKYFVSSEYGGQFHRPHYHILFFLYLDISPELFNQLIQECWSLGINDMYKKDGSLKLARDKVINGHGAIQYVSKYVNKDDDFYLWLEKAMLEAEGKEFTTRLDDFETFEEIKEYRDNVLSQYMSMSLRTDIKSIIPFHLQSNGYGISLACKSLIDNDGNTKHTRDYIFMYNEGMISFHDENHAERHVKIPQYIRRKLWYQSYKDFDGSWHWILNDEGIRQKLDHLNKSIDILSQKYAEIDYNLHNYLSSDEIGKYNDIKKEIHILLGNRSWHDFATYLLVYKGRLLDDQSDLPDLYDLYANVQTISPESRSTIDLDKDSFTQDMVRRVTSCDTYMDYYTFLDYLSKKLMINENSFYIFHDFDKLYSIFVQLQKYRNNQIELANLEKANIKRNAKLLDYRYAQHEKNNLKHRKHIQSNILRYV